MKKGEIQEIFQVFQDSENKWETIRSALEKIPNLSFFLLSRQEKHFFLWTPSIHKKLKLDLENDADLGDSFRIIWILEVLN